MPRPGQVRQNRDQSNQPCGPDLLDSPTPIQDVGFADLLRLLSAWGVCSGCPEDLDDDDDVGFSDLLIVLANWGPCE